MRITVAEGDITTQDVDAIVNPASTKMRGGGGKDVDGAVHRAGGPAVLQDCIERFPDGLAVGDAGWTTAGRLSARWVIHTVGPNYHAGQRDRTTLESCYRRALTVADELGARTVAFPLISTGSFGWPIQDAIAAAIETIAATDTEVEEVRLVAFDAAMREAVDRQLFGWTPIRILQGVRALHQRGYHRLRVLPGWAPSGMYWRVAIGIADDVLDAVDPGPGTMIRYTTGALTEFAGGEVTVTATPESVADLILNQLTAAVATHDDPGYVAWYGGLLSLVEQTGWPPVAYEEYFDPGQGWDIGGIRYPQPLPAPPGTTDQPGPE